MNDDKKTNDLLEKLSLSGLGQDKKTEVLSQLDQLVEARVALAITEKLDEETNKQLDDLVDNGTPEQLIDLIKKKIPDYDTMVAKINEDTIEELANNKDAVLAEVDRLRAEEPAA